MPDPKGLAEAIATDLEAVGFTINFKTEGWRTGYLSDSATGKFPMFLLGWTCDWAGPDNFLITDLFYFNSDGTPNPQFSYGTPELKKAFDDALAATNDADATANWEQGAGHHRRRSADHPDPELDPAGRLCKHRPGLPGQRQPDRVLQHGLAQPVASRPT